MKDIVELCPYCNKEVVLKNAREKVAQPCPSCKKLIYPCNLCDTCTGGKCALLNE